MVFFIFIYYIYYWCNIFAHMIYEISFHRPVVEK